MRTNIQAWVATLGLITAGCGTTTAMPVTDEPAPASHESHPLFLGAANLQVGTVETWNDETTLFLAYTLFPGYEMTDAYVCASGVGFHWMTPEACSYGSKSFAPQTTRTTVNVPLANLGENLAGSLLFFQASAKIVEAGAMKDTAYAGTWKGRIGYVVAGTPAESVEGSGCTLSAAEWSVSKKEWSTESLVLGGQTYRRDALESLLASPKGADASVMLGKELAAALLNVASGASAPSGVTAAFDGLDLWMGLHQDADGMLPFAITAAPGSERNTASFEYAVNMAEMLRQYNEGRLSTARCN